MRWPVAASKPKTESALIQAALRETRSPQVAEIAGHFVDLVKGPRGFAELLFKEFMKADEGGIARQRILSDVLQAMKFANTKEEGKTDLGILSEEDLEHEARLVLGVPKEAPGSEPEPPECVDEPHGQQESQTTEGQPGGCGDTPAGGDPVAGPVAGSPA